MGLGKRSPGGTDMDLCRGRKINACFRGRGGMRVAGEVGRAGKADTDTEEGWWMLRAQQNWLVTHPWWAMAPSSPMQYLCRHRAEQLWGAGGTG